MISTDRAHDDGPSTCFTCTRLNPSTFRIVEADKYGEFPFIYAKIYDAVIVLIDTGCGGAAEDPGVKLTSLRDFIETYPVEENHGKPLNSQGTKSYVVICTHCHYDHIGEHYLSSRLQSARAADITPTRCHCSVHRYP